ncbi:hypothetical protein ACLOJK_021968 [Asimina triloba]
MKSMERAIPMPDAFKLLIKLKSSSVNRLCDRNRRCEKVVIHQDIKANNIVLDGEMNGRLSDFGLARSYGHGSAPHITHVAGTFGYLAPELNRTGKANNGTDAFAIKLHMQQFIPPIMFIGACEKVVIHREIKAINIVLDGEMNGRLGDFGLARSYGHGSSPHITHVAGTFGYLAPELNRTGKANNDTVRGLWEEVDREAGIDGGVYIGGLGFGVL